MFCRSQGFAGPSACILDNGHDGPHKYGDIATAEAERRRKDTARLDWLAMYGSFGVDSVSGIPGGNGQKRVAATRAEIDAAMLKTPNASFSGADPASAGSDS